MILEKLIFKDNFLSMERVVIGLLGTQLDSGFNEERWGQWRPTVSIFQHEDLLVDRLELIYDRQWAGLAKRVMEDIRMVSPETETRGHLISYGSDPWDLQSVYGALHDWARSMVFDQDREEYLIHITTGTHIAQISLFLLTEARILPGKLLQTSPPVDRKNRRAKGAEYNIIDLDLSKYDHLATRFAREQAEAAEFLKNGIATRNAAFNRMIDRIEQVALRSRAPMLLFGPTGAGKSELARRIHELRHQRGGLAGKFVEVNCATLRGDTAASALFGHTKGAFTGASGERPGLLREAHGGLLFLDEIGELGPDEQAMLLRALEDKTFLPVGSDKPVKSDFLLVAGTNRDLRAEVAAGKFREDLLARIQLWSFQLPPLAERREDIEPNLDYELRRFSEQQGKEISFNKEAREKFLSFALDPATPWSGNFRDLNAAITRMGTLANRGRITVADVNEEIARLKESWARPGAVASELEDPARHVAPEVLEEVDPFDRIQLAHVLAVCRRHHSLSAAGRVLFSASRQRKAAPNDADRLKKYLARFGLTFAEIG